MEVISVVREFITEELLRRRDLALADDVLLIEDGYLTSLQTVELLMFLEKQFQVEVDPEEVNEDNFRSLKALKLDSSRKNPFWSGRIERKLG